MTKIRKAKAMENVSLGDRIRRSRERRNLTRYEVATKIGISAEYFAKLEYDAPVPLSKGLHEKLKKVLHVRLPPKVVDKHNKRSARVYAKYLRNR